MNQTATTPNGYTVTDDGRIFSPNGREIKQRTNRKGYRLITWNDSDHGCRHYGQFVHRIVAQYFVQNPLPLLFTQINHIDGNPANNHAENLEWCDCKYNAEDRRRRRARLGQPWLTVTDKVREARRKQSKPVIYGQQYYPSFSAFCCAMKINDRKYIRSRIGRTWHGIPLRYAEKVSGAQSSPIPAPPVGSFQTKNTP